MKNRQCSPCTACCDGSLTAEINGVKMMPGVPCVHSTKQGCGIYESRPEVPCVSFTCGWLKEQDRLPEKMKPSECGAIVIFDRKWHNRTVIRAIPTDKTIPSITLKWLKAYARKHATPLLLTTYVFKDGKIFATKKNAYGPPSFVHAVKTEIGPQDVLMY
jgi:hypothetical protein